MIEGIAVMHLMIAIILLLILIPAAVAGIGSALIEAVTKVDCISAALPHASAMLAEVAPLAPPALLLLAGVATLGMAGWLIVRTVNG